jgi:hypothetical protein
MTPKAILRSPSAIEVDDILLKMADGRKSALRRVAPPKPAQARILEALTLTLPEAVEAPDRICSEDLRVHLS